MHDINGMSDILVKAILSVTEEDACRRLVADLFTPNEVKAISQRLMVARMLRAGTTYQEIEAATSVSSATIARVNRALLYGEGGYTRLLDNMFEKG